MSMRQAASATRRRAHHLQQLRQANTAAGQLWRACTWLVAEARRSRRLTEATQAVLGLVHIIQHADQFPDGLLVTESGLSAGDEGPAEQGRTQWARPHSA